MLFSVFIQETCTCSWLLFRCWQVRYFFPFLFCLVIVPVNLVSFIILVIFVWQIFLSFRRKITNHRNYGKIISQSERIYHSKYTYFERLPWSMIQTTRDICENNPNFKHLIISKYNFKKLINVNMTEVGTVWMNEGLVVISYH